MIVSKEEIVTYVHQLICAFEFVASNLQLLMIF
jgi:hypothetical protein